MTPEQLKASILQYAFEGKLVSQDNNTEKSTVLYASIVEEKKKMEKAGEIKKSKKLPAIEDNEIPYDIPDNWCWVRLNDIVYNHGQKTPDCTFSYIDIGSIDNLHQKLNKEETLIEVNNAPSRARKIVKYGDIIYSTVRPYLHNTCIIDKKFSKEPIASTGFAVLACHTGLYNKYLFYYLLAPVFDSYANSTENAKGVAYPAINDDKLYRAIVPLPPLAEQHRIVAKIEELLPFVDRYAASYEKLEQFNAKFPEDMKKSILQYAIMGKLVEQRPEEGTAEDLYKSIQEEKQKLIKEGKIKKEKPLAEIKEDEIPFDIPDSWKWVRISTIGITQTGNTPKKSHPEYFGSDIPFLGPGDIQNGIINYENQGLSDEGKEYGRITPANSILQVCIGGSLGKCALVDREVAFNQQINSIYPLIANSEYVYHILDSSYLKKYMKDNAGGTATPIINRGLWDAIVIPLPPLKEQERIVAKIKELLPYCDQLIK